MKKVLMTVALVMTATSAFAFQGPAAANGITGTRHDIPGASDTTTQKCVFCHTPHNPRVNVPLWNRQAGAAIATVYNSPSLTSAGKSASVTVNSISGFCMSCHDGVTQMGAIVNQGLPGAATIGIGAANIQTFSPGTKANLTTNLSGSHPVGFSYNAAYNEDFVTAAGPRLKAPAAVATTFGTANPPFYGAAGDQMECASCHKVHDDRIAPFLRYTNAASALCLACHNK